jgi:hypothetical protein
MLSMESCSQFLLEVDIAHLEHGYGRVECTLYTPSRVCAGNKGPIVWPSAQPLAYSSQSGPEP